MENNTYTPLPLTYRKNGYDYTQVSRTDEMAIYEQKYATKIIAFEVYVIQRMEAGERIMAGVPVKMEAKEFVPSSEQWGKLAWTCRDLSEAHSKTHVISKKRFEARNGQRG